MAAGTQLRLSNPFINDGGACSYCDDYAGWSKQCFDKLQPVEASLKDFGSYAQKFKQLWEKEDFQHPVTSLVSIVSELGDGAVDFFQIVSILFECVQPQGATSNVKTCSGGQKLNALATPYAGNRDTGEYCWSLCHPNADKNKWESLVAQDCANSGLVLSSFGSTVSSIFASKSITNSLVETKTSLRRLIASRVERGQKWSSVVDAIKKGASATEKAANSAIKSAHAAITNVISDTNDAINDARTVAKKVISDTINDARTVANNVLNSKASTDIFMEPTQL